MEPLIILLGCIIYFIGVAIIPVTLLASIVFWLEDMYCKKRFGESLFQSKKENEA